MLKLVACVTQQHDLPMVALAALICALGAYATFAVGVYARSLDRVSIRLRWAALTALTSACSIWSTHFIAMIAFRASMPSGFLPIPTILSFVFAVALVTVAGVIGLRARRRRGAAASGAVLGLAISAMHYTGMSAFRTLGEIVWDPATVAASVAIGLVFSMLSLLAVRGPSGPRIILPAAFFIVAVCGDHFVGMSGATIVFEPGIALPAGLIDGRSMSYAVAAIAALIIAMALGAYGLHRQQRRRGAAERRRLEDFGDFSVEGLVICDGDTIVWANRSVQALRPDRATDCVGRPITTLLAADVVDRLSAGCEIDALLGDGANATPVRVITKPIDLEDRPHRVIAFRDQRERLRAEAEMRRLASSDALTGLANRTRFNEVIERMLTSGRVDGRGFALLSLDLDRFKQVNDVHGHAAGDALLVRVAGRLCSMVDASMLVARLGGDEFSIITPTDGPDGARTLAERVVELLSRPFLIDGEVHEIGSSVGVALAPSDADTAIALVRCADLALYRAKEDGGGIHHLFEAGMDARMQARRALELALRRAAARQEFQLFYQPQVDARTGQVTGAEALIRWIDPQRGIVPPMAFIPIAEETNLIAGIGEWVLHTACAEAATWPSPLNVAVNLSPVQFRDPRLLSIVRSALEESGLPGHRLELEITESVLIRDEANVLEMMRAFKALDVRIALDDFGIGYSSLGHLRRFPFDKIKIDRSFVDRADQDRDSAAIVRAVVTLGASLGMSTTAEGVETEEQRRFLVAEGCDQIQGYLVGRPVPASDLPAPFRSRATSTPWRSSDSSIAATAS